MGEGKRGLKEMIQEVLDGGNGQQVEIKTNLIDERKNEQPMYRIMGLDGNVIIGPLPNNFRTVTKEEKKYCDYAEFDPGDL